MAFLNTNSLRNKIYTLVILIPLLLISDQLMAKESRLLILGDSLSAAYGLKQEQGWVSLLQDAWQNKPITIINAAISGETTDGALARLPRLLNTHQPTHVFIELGGNDGLQGHPIHKMRDNLQSIIDLSQKSGSKVFLQQMQIPTNYGRRYTESFTSSYTQLASENDIPLLPFFLEEIALNENLMQRDGIHPTAEAQVIIAKGMQQTLEVLIFP
ncbi:arylesterase [uncultured Paraglaciecola sp.]|uniref:arylesterase n=1 Tax=uncultured Paraglaciecola sp. TaxID=1765024 RepID=UPI0025966C0E|nr:arylesterase [uncultured Paraglaciecola sp.]